MVTGDPQPWERLPAETSRAHEAFRQFRDLGPTRRLRDVDAHIGTVRGWSLRHRWVERAQAWDAETHRLDDARRLDAIRSMDETHRQVARTLVARGLEGLRDNAEPLTAHQAARLVDLGTRLERAALLGEHLGPITAPAGDVEDLSPLERIARELAGTA